MLKKLENKLNKKYIAYIIISLFTLIAYSNSFTVPFTLDDFSSISNNHAIRRPWDLPALWNFYSGRIVAYFTFSINYFIHQTAYEGYHIVNTLIHITNAIIVFLILNNILGLSYFNRKPVQRYRNLVSLLGAIAFATHPIQVNAVTYVVQRIASLAAMFYLLSVLFFIRYRITGKIKYFILALLTTLLAMFTKENTITIPFMLILIEFMFFLKHNNISWKKRIAIILILLLTVPIIPATPLYLGGHSQSDPGADFKASTTMDRFEYFYTQLNVIVKYIKLLFIPDNLNFDYSNDFDISKTIWENSSYISLIILSSIGILALLLVKKNKLVSFGILWFFMGLAVESSFISIKDVYFEHRLYFPMVGFVMFIIGAIFSEARILHRRFLFDRPMLFFTVFMSITIAMNSVNTLHRNYIFSDSVRLWTDVVSKAPNSDRAHCILATNYLNLVYDKPRSTDKQNLEMAEKEFNKALAINSRNGTAHCNLSKVYLLKKEYLRCIQKAEYSNSLSKSEYAFYNMGKAYEALGNTDKAIESYLGGYKVNNRFTFILKSLGNCYEKKKDYKNAIKYYEEFIQNNDFSGNKEIRNKVDELKKNLK